MSHYVTDSVSFRKFIGVFDSANETFVYDCQDDSLLIKKYLNDGVNNKIIDERIVLIKDLKLKKELE